MGNIQVADIKADLKDRLANFVERGQINEAIQRKLLLDKRVGTAIDEAYRTFVLKATPDILSQLVTRTEAIPDDSINETNPGAGDGNGIKGGVKHYTMPTDIYTAREDSGILTYLINDSELKPERAIPLTTLRSTIDSPYYSDVDSLFSTDIDTNRIYADPNTDVLVEYIKEPQSVVRDNITELLIRDTYYSDIVNMTEAVIMGQNIQQENNEPEQQEQVN